MSKFSKFLICTLFIIFSLQSAYAQQTKFKNTSLPLEERITALMKELTTEEKIDFLCAASSGVERLGIPAYDWWSEALHGVARNGKATVFPKPIGLGSTWDVELLEKIATAISDEARAKYHAALSKQGFTKRYEGLTYFSPTLNIARDPRWGRTSESFSEDPLLVGSLGTAFVKGMQGNDPKYLKLVATPKHFVANNEEDRRNDGSASVDDVSLREYYFPAFRKSIEEGKATSVMGAYNAFNGVPCCANPFLLTQVLRKEWGFDGVVMSDGSAIQKLFTHHHFASSPEEGAAKALLAGCDMSLRDEYREGLKDALSQSLITESNIDTALHRVLKLRFRLGMFDPNEKVAYSKIPVSVIESEEHRQLALEAARKSVILLKNDAQILPLKKNKIKRIALIGNDFSKNYYGDYSGMPDYNLSLLDAIREKAGKDIAITWVPEISKDELIASEYFIRDKKYEYDGRLGLTGMYFANNNLSGDPIVVRHDYSVDFKPFNDENQQIKNEKVLSARWFTSIDPPVTGEYTMSVKGTLQAKLTIDGKSFEKESQTEELEIKVQLNKGTLSPIQLECFNIDPKQEIQLAWRLPVSEQAVTIEEAAKNAEVAIVFIRDDVGNEGRDRKSLAIQPHQLELVKKVRSINPNTILIIGSGAPLILDEISQQAKALLNIWIAGQGESQAIADILFGDVNPSGKTPVTFYADESELPAIDNYDIKEGRSYQYFKGNALYPFGYGLSYTTFQYGQPKIVRVDKDEIELRIAVTNNGGYDGDDVLQCYASTNKWKEDGIKQRLVAFKRVHVTKGQKKAIALVIKRSEFERWDLETENWKTVLGTYKLSIGNQSVNIKF